MSFFENYLIVQKQPKLQSNKTSRCPQCNDELEETMTERLFCISCQMTFDATKIMLTNESKQNFTLGKQ